MAKSCPECGLNGDQRRRLPPSRSTLLRSCTKRCMSCVGAFSEQRANAYSSSGDREAGPVSLAPGDFCFCARVSAADFETNWGELTVRPRRSASEAIHPSFLGYFFRSLSAVRVFSCAEAWILSTTRFAAEVGV